MLMCVGCLGIVRDSKNLVLHVDVHLATMGMYRSLRYEICICSLIQRLSLKVVEGIV